MSKEIKHSEELLKQVATVPHKPGVYQYFDKNENIIYIGKAKNLKKRVSSYFNKTLDRNKTYVMVKQIHHLKYIVVETEMDALLLENTLIKEYQPKYNIELRDDKTYPWICIKKEPYPRIFSTRKLIKDGSEYFGPYSSVVMMKTLLNLISDLYPLRTCSLNLTEKNIKNEKFKVCLEYHIKRCLGPCEEYQTKEDYDDNIQEIKNILKGNLNEVVKSLKHKMTNYAESQNYEEAQLIKEKLELLEKYQARSTIVNPKINNVDVFSILDDTSFAYINYLRITDGRVIQSHTIEVKKNMNEEVEDILSICIIEIRKLFQSDNKTIYTSIPLKMDFEDIKLHHPQRGDKQKLIELSLKNANYYKLERYKQIKIVNPEAHSNRILEQLKKDLRLRDLPTHIECFDNSNFQGTNAVAACVVFKNAKPSKKDYRHFNIKTVEGPDDFASMEEVVYRRYSRLLKERESLPQLIVIDGGKGQLSSAIKSLKQLDLYGKISIIGIAKKLEEIYFPDDSLPLYIDKRSESLKLIQQLRNEAHRFGITHHRNKRSKAAYNSELSYLKGFGEKTLVKLYKHFKTLNKIKEATDEELLKIINQKQLVSLREHFS